MTMINKMIYVHIPFCDSKCYYCNFCSANYPQEIRTKYFEKLLEEIKFNSNKNFEVSSIYIGGGTPSSVDEKYIQKILLAIKENYIIKSDAEISIECNPCSITEQKLFAYKSCGVNRISFGVQTLNNKQLKQIGRRHNKKQAKNAIKLAKMCGFSNINADFLIGIPNQSYFSLKSNLSQIIKLGVTHISAYMLINESGTKLTKLIEDKKVKVPTEDKCVYMYNKMVGYLKKKNYHRYEISNFSLQGFECKHNQGYWQMTEYYGFGLAAHSFVCGARYSNTSVMDEYLNFDFNYQKENLSNEEIIEELIMLGLRTQNGVNKHTLKNYGYNYDDKKEIIDNLRDNHFITEDEDYIRVCEDKFGVTNQIILKLL